MLRTYRLILAAGGLLFLAGCGGSTFPSVTGTVTLDGQPLDGAVVVFSPDGGAGGGQVATGVTDSDGSFKMGTLKLGDGVRPGKYHVTITKTAEPIEPTPYFGDVMAKKFAAKSGDERKDTKEIGKDVKQMQAEQQTATKKRRPTPGVYQDPVKTPLTADVPAQREYKFELKSDAK
jgi:hypothetical protein